MHLAGKRQLWLRLHSLGILATVIYNPKMGYSLPKVSLDSIDSSLEQGFDQARVPGICRRIGKVHQGRTRLPLVPDIRAPVSCSPLKHVAIGSLDKVSLFTALVENIRSLA